MIYLDHAATTPLDPKVLDQMTPYFISKFGNPSSIHQAGRQAQEGIISARAIVSKVLNARDEEIVFTSGGSESNNLAIKGIAALLIQKRKFGHIVTSAIEHHSVLHAVESLSRVGFDITLLPVTEEGFVRPDTLEKALRKDTILVSIAYANNEIGTIQPISEIGSLCKERGIWFHSDAVQAAGLLPLDVEKLNVDLLTLSAHKFYGPRGAGLLYIRKGTKILPLIDGGEQERNLRAGTENTPAIVGLAAALKNCEAHREDYVNYCTLLRNQLMEGLLSCIENSWLNGSRDKRLPNNANLSFCGIDSDSLVMLLDQFGICVSSGSACTSNSLNPSHVLLALGIDFERVSSAVRLTVGKMVTQEDITIVLDTFPKVVQKLRHIRN